MNHPAEVWAVRISPTQALEICNRGPVVTTDDVAAIVGRHCDTVSLWARQGRIKGMQFGRRWIFDSDYIKHGFGLDALEV